MNKLMDIFKSVAEKTVMAKDVVLNKSLKVCAGWQALNSHGYSKWHRTGKLVCIGGLFAASVIGLNIEGVIGAGVGLTDELAFLAKIGDDVEPSGHDLG